VPLSSLAENITIKIALFFCLVILTSCGSSSVQNTDGFYDPHEERNRKVHAFNIKLDQKIFRPVATEYSTILPDLVENSINDFAENLGQPSVVVNSFLQGDLRGVSVSATSFMTNTILGLGGFVDIAEFFGMEEHDTDFGETLYKWGAEEGEYVELPFLGPSTVRSTTGLIVDSFIDPFTYIAGRPEKYYGTLASTSSSLSARSRFSATIDSILYESSDSYAQARLIYLQNRRFELRSDVTSSAFIDPYEDPYDQ